MSELGQRIAEERAAQKDGIAPRGSIYLHDVRAKFTLDQDLGHVKGHVNFDDFDLDDQTRDRLLVHARHDASLAVNTAYAAEKLGITNRRLLLAVLLLQCLLVWRTW